MAGTNSRQNDNNEPEPESFQGILMTMLGASVISALLALALTFIVVGGIWLFAASPVVLALTPFTAIIFATTAWGSAGIGAGIAGFGMAIRNLLMPNKEGNVEGWLALGLGLIGIFATAGAIVGTFIPVPVLGTLVGAASGAVIGVLAGAAAWAFAGIVGAIVIKSKETPTTEIKDDDASNQSNSNSVENKQIDSNNKKNLSSAEKPHPHTELFQSDNKVVIVETQKKYNPNNGRSQL